MPTRPLAPERRRAVFECLAAGLTPAQASRATGVSLSACYALHRSVGGVYRPARAGDCQRFLDRDERYEIARLREAGRSLRSIAVAVGRSPSTISRELARNRDPRTGGYQPERADRLARARQRRPKPSKLAADPVLRAVVQQMLDRRFSPEQISGRLKVLHPDNPRMRVSHETIYLSLYVHPRGELRRELKAALRTGRAVRRRRGERASREQIPGAVSIHDRPAEVAARLIPGHHEGDLIMGSVASNSAVGTIVERTTGYLTLLPLHDGHTAEKVTDAIVTQLTALPDWFVKTLTWDRGRELTRHRDITERLGISIYFADPYSPQQRGSNENINGLLRQYLPKSTDLSIHTPADLQAIADELNDRPRKRLGFHTPREVLDKLITNNQLPVATTT